MYPPPPGAKFAFVIFAIPPNTFPIIDPSFAAMSPALSKNLVSSPEASCRLRRSAIPAVLFSKNLLNLFIRGSAATNTVKNPS
jgi:hypothetical protein